MQYNCVSDIIKLGVYFTSPSATTPTSRSVNIEVTVGPIVAVFLFLVLLLLILLILVALKRNNRQNAVGAAPSEVELHKQERYSLH